MKRLSRQISKYTIRACAFCLIIALSGCATTETKQKDASATRTNNATSSSMTEAATQQYSQALEHMHAGAYQQAKHLLEPLAKDYPHLASIWANLGIALQQQQDFEGAEAAYLHALDSNPQLALANHQLGILYRQQGRFTESEQRYLLALKTKPDYALAHRNLGILYDIYLHKPEKAMQQYQRYQAITGTADQEIKVWMADLERRIARQ